MVVFVNNHPEAMRFTTPEHDSWLDHVCHLEGLRLGDLGVYVVSDDELLEVNRQFLNHDYLTDIITFDRCYGKIVTGELWISLDRVLENAVTLNADAQDEFDRVLVHGLLHLLGYKDKSEADAMLMRKKEAEALVLRAMK